MNLQSLTAQRKLHDRINFRGLQISVENRKHSLRQGVGKGGKRWQSFIRIPYGYLRGTVGVDGDHVDVFVGPNLDAPNVYVIHTQDPETQKYDEDKVFLGIMTAPEAKLEFLRNYDSPGHFQSMDTIPFEEFRERMLGGDGKGKKIEAFGTSEGVRKEWDTRGRGRHATAEDNLFDALTQWVGDSSTLSKQVAKVVESNPSDIDPSKGPADAIASGIRDGVQFSRFTPVYRGIYTQRPTEFDNLKKGDTFDIHGASSFTTSLDVASIFASKNSSVNPVGAGVELKGARSVLLRVVGVRGLDVGKYTGEEDDPEDVDEKEIVTNGIFQVTGVSKAGEMTIIRAIHLGTH